MQTNNIPVRPRPQETAKVLGVMSTGAVRETVQRLRGEPLRALLDAAMDVAEQSEWQSVRQTAQEIIAMAHVYHPEYFDSTLRGV